MAKKNKGKNNQNNAQDNQNMKGTTSMNENTINQGQNKKGNTSKSGAQSDYTG